MKKSVKTTLAVAGCVAVAIAAYASVTINLGTGTGFVGKGDVQTVLGMNNAQIQAAVNNNQVNFTYVTEDTYEVVTAWASGNEDKPVSLNYHTATVTTVANVNSAVAYDPRKNKNAGVTGFNLTGFGSQTVLIDGAPGEIPVKSPTVAYVTFTWDEQVWTGEYEQVWDPNKWTGEYVQVWIPETQIWHAKPNPGYWETVPGHYVNGDKIYGMYVNGDKIYDTVTHETDQLPAYPDENGNLVLYTEGNNKAVLAVTLLDSVGGLFVNGVALPITPTP